MTIQITSDSSDVVPQEQQVQVQVQVQAQVTAGLSPSSVQHGIYHLRGKCVTQNYRISFENCSSKYNWIQQIWRNNSPSSRKPLAYFL